jgi:heme oxygenase (biliverdin-IX-beta and delta-forming)
MMRMTKLPAGSAKDACLVSPVLDSLRQKTSGLHRQAERALDLPRATSSLAEYIGLLHRLLGFYLPLEEQLFRHLPPVQLHWESRRKSPALQADLRALQAGVARIEPCSGIPALACELERIGAWYVVEGATLGGQVISLHLARRLGLSRDHGGCFFDVYGSQRQQRWDEFRDHLGSLAAENAASVCAGAQAVFDALRLWLATRPAAAPAPRAACAPAHL